MSRPVRRDTLSLPGDATPGRSRLRRSAAARGTATPSAQATHALDAPPRRPDCRCMTQPRRNPRAPRRGFVRWLAVAAALATALLALPILLGWLEGPRFPILDPSPWEALKQYGRNLTFRR